MLCTTRPPYHFFRLTAPVIAVTGVGVDVSRIATVDFDSPDGSSRLQKS